MYRLGVALGGGGMKGWAHVGVLRVLGDIGLTPDVVAGTSAGALIGAFWAAGMPVDEMMRVMREQKTRSLFSWRFDGQGLFSTDGMRAYLDRHFGERTFADLERPFFVVATDLERGREVVLREGRIVDALLASTAMPGIFAPVEHKGMLLVDGGVVNNVPVSVLTGAGARYTIAVRLHDPVHTAPLRRMPMAAAGSAGSAGAARAAGAAGGTGGAVPIAPDDSVSVSLWAGRLMRRFRPDASTVPGGLDVAGRALDILASRVESACLQLVPPDVLISPDVARFGTLSFAEEKEWIYRCGVDAAEMKREALVGLAARLAGSH